MNLFELFVKIGVDDQASDKISTLSNKLGNGLKTAAKIGTTAVSTATAGITALTTAAVNSFAEYEQLVGGAELMFGDAYNTVMENASQAYKTVQMSQNEYLQQVNGFATGLKTALGGNEQAAADLAHKIIQAEADIVAATGNSQEAVQNAFNGIMKSNFTMLDNLQIGITPTKEGFQEVIDKVNDWNVANGEATAYQMGNLADMQAALVDYIEMVGMSGYAQSEAAGTISGSVATLKAAWSDFLTSLADENADYQWQLDNLLTSVKTVATNIYPVAEQVFWSIADMAEDVLPEIANKIPAIISEVLPKIVDIAVKLVESLIEGISQTQETLTTTITDLVFFLVESFVTMLPEIIKLGLDVIKSLAKGITKNLPELTSTTVDVILEIVDILTDPHTLSELIDASIAVVETLADGLIEALPELIDKAPKIITNLVTALVENVPKLLNASYKIIVALVTGIVDNLPQLGRAAGQIIEAVGNGIVNLGRNLLDVGKNIVSGIWEGIANSGDWLMDKVSGFFGGVVDGIKSLLGIASPSKVFRDDIGKMMAMGIGVGFDKEMGNVEKTITSDFDKLTSGLNADMNGNITYGLAHGITGAYGMAGANLGGVTINVNVGGTNSTAEDIAEAISEALQNMTDRKVAVYG